MAASPSSTATDQPNIGHPPAGPERLTLREWVDVFKRAFREFLKDDCMGLAQQIAFSSLLLHHLRLAGVVPAADPTETPRAEPPVEEAVGRS